MSTATQKKPVASAKPGTKDDKAAKPKHVRIDYPVPAEKLTARPADYDQRKYNPLKRADFQSEANFLDYRAEGFERMAKRLREQAVTSAKLGNVKDRAKAKRLVMMQKKMDELRAQLVADGVDVDDLFRAATKDAGAAA